MRAALFGFISKYKFWIAGTLGGSLLGLLLMGIPGAALYEFFDLMLDRRQIPHELEAVWVYGILYSVTLPWAVFITTIALHKRGVTFTTGKMVFFSLAISLFIFFLLHLLFSPGLV